MIIKLLFNKNIYYNITKIFLEPNNDIKCHDNSHQNYIYKENIGDCTYIFNGFFKDDYLCIICDIYDNKIDINICHKNVMLIKLDWIYYKISEEKSIWILDESKLKNFDINCIILPIRNNLYLIQSLNIKDYLNICNYEYSKLNIKIINNQNTFYKIWNSFLFIEDHIEKAISL